MQSATPSPSASESAAPQPHTPGAVLFTSSGQPSQASMRPSRSRSLSQSSGTPLLLQSVLAPLEMSQDDYAESWAWVHLLLGGSAEQGEILRDYLGALRRDGSTEPLSQRLATRLDRYKRDLAADVAGSGR